MTPEILYKSKNIIVIYKPPLLPSESDMSGDKDALSLTAELLRADGEREELYLINRLDRVVGGLMVLARNKKTTAALSELLLSDKFLKEYFAVADGEVSCGEMRDFIVKDSRRSMAVITDENKPNAKEAMLYSDLLDTAEHKQKKKSLLSIRLKTGRFHQIRAQLSHRGAPLIGDKKYGSKDFLSRQPALFAYHVFVEVAGETVDVYKLPELEKYPWNLFSAEKYIEKTRKKS